jgi:hypothetical protein
MSFVPAPQQASAAGANNNNAGPAVTSGVAALAAQVAAAPETSDAELVFKLRTFGKFW